MRPLLSILRYVATAVIATSLFFACQPSQKTKNEELELQKKQWVADMKEAFPDKTDDTVELKRRLDHFIKTENKIGQQQIYRVLGNFARNSSRFRIAIENHTLAMQVSYEIKDTINITVTLNDIGTDFRRIGAFTEATPYYYRSLQVAEEYRGADSAYIDRNMASSYNGLGSVYRAMNECDEAINVYNKALELEEKHDNFRGMGINYANIGSIYFDQGEYEKAEEFYIISLENNDKAGNPVGIALCKINIGKIYEVKGMLDQALALYKEAYDILIQTPDKWHWLKSCFYIAETYMNMGDYAKAYPYLESGQRISLEIKSPAHIQEVYNLLSRYNYARENYRKSVDELRISQAYADTIQRNLEVDRLMESRVKYETDKYTKQIEVLDELHQEQIAKRKQVMILLIPLLVVLLALVLLLIYKRRLDRRQAMEIKNLERMRTNFFTNITHEFRTPLTVIIGLGKQLLLGKTSEGENLKTQGEMIVRQGNSLLELINQLLDLSKVKSAIGDPDWRAGDVVAYLNMIVESQQTYAHQRRIDLNFVSAETSITMDFVPDYMHKIILNLLSNAIKHTPEYGRVFVTSKKNNDKLVICVTDTGVGIDKEDLPHIFEAFYQGENSSTSIGTGVGLSLVYQIVKSMNGEIEVKSNKGEGSVFTVTLPIKHGEKRWETYVPTEDTIKDVAVVHTSEKVVLPSNDESDSLMSTILIVEDNTDISFYIGLQLQDRYKLYYAKNGEDGLEKAKDLMPDLIITDLMMPGMDGYELCRSVRSSDILSHIPIVIITAKCSEEDRIKGLQAGADAYLTKPFSSDELNVRVEKLLDMRRSLREKYSQALSDGLEQVVNLIPADQEFLNKLVAVIYKQMNNGELDTETVADKMCMSRSQLSRKISSITGHNTATYILQIRMGKAKRLLKSDENIPIGEVAIKCGYSDIAHFSRIFKQMYQMTPSQYRKSSY